MMRSATPGPIPDAVAVVFDLDDTLYKESDFVASAYKLISCAVGGAHSESVFREMWEGFLASRSVFDDLVARHDTGLSVDDLVSIYRFHFPVISLAEGARALLDNLKTSGVTLGLVTDGRTKTQLNKIRALGIESYFDRVVISEQFGSEKPHQRNFECLHENAPPERCVYVADNPAKDFCTPNRLGWVTIGIRADHRNIHSQGGAYPSGFQPSVWVDGVPNVWPVLQSLRMFKSLT